MIDFLRVESRSFMFTAAAGGDRRRLGALEIIRSDEAQLMARVLDNALPARRLGRPRLPGDGAEPAAGRLRGDHADRARAVGDDWKAVFLWKALYDAGVYVNVAIYPAVQRGGMLRTSVMATHEGAPRPRP